MDIFNRFINPKGFKFGAVRSGIKANSKDLGVIYSEQPAKSATFYTTNTMAAAPIQVSKEHQEATMPQAIIVNSGNANAATGKEGLNDAYKMAKVAATSLGVKEEAVLVASTGVIGKPLPMKKVEEGIKKAVKGMSAIKGPEVAQAIMTTDKITKQVSSQFEIDGNLITLSGIAKGSGMIAPNMKRHRALRTAIPVSPNRQPGGSQGGQATMLAFIFTDLRISRKAMYKILEEINERTFNSITVDGDTSTNDMVVVLANSLAGNRKIIPSSKHIGLITEAFEKVFSSLSRQIVKDGEGASKLIEVNVKGVKNEFEAKKIAKTIADSNLVKTAFAGQSANWGRILSAAGYSGVDFDPRKVKLSFNGLELVKNGVGLKVDKRKLKTVMSKYNIKVELNLKQGKAEATYLTTDLTSDYIKINANYLS